MKFRHKIRTENNNDFEKKKHDNFKLLNSNLKPNKLVQKIKLIC